VAEKDEKYTQPFLVTVGHGLRPTQFFLAVDRQVIPCCSQQFVHAIDMLFRAHYVFDVQYAAPLHQFWEFLAANVYVILDPAKTRPSVRALGSACREMDISEDEEN
jgi:hypothetical protein